jgi:hypothetical protein
MNHMGLSVTADDVNEVSAAFETLGVEVSEKTPRKTVFIHDPDGHCIEILPVSAPVRAL